MDRVGVRTWTRRWGISTICKCCQSPSFIQAHTGNHMLTAPYRLGANLTYNSPALRADVIEWGLWIVRTLNLSGFRLDAMKHMSQSFVLFFMRCMQQEFGSDFLFIGEYWKWDSRFLANIAKKMEGRCRLYDTQLFYNFSDYSLGKREDLRNISEGTLIERDPAHSVASRLAFSYPLLVAPADHW